MPTCPPPSPPLVLPRRVRKTVERWSRSAKVPHRIVERTKIVALMKSELDWSRMEPKMVEVYRNTFTAAEIEGMLKFYDSPVGRSVIVKQPQATQQLMQLIHEDMRTVIPQIIQLQQDAGARIRAAADPGTKPSPQ